jgi:hypothetical protein
MQAAFTGRGGRGHHDPSQQLYPVLSHPVRLYDMGEGAGFLRARGPAKLNDSSTSRRGQIGVPRLSRPALGRDYKLVNKNSVKRLALASGSVLHIETHGFGVQKLTGQNSHRASRCWGFSLGVDRDKVEPRLRAAAIGPIDARINSQPDLETNPQFGGEHPIGVQWFSDLV